MSSVDNRIVKMQFDNASFKREALATKGALEQVDAAVNKTGNSKGLLGMASAMETVKVKAGAMQVAAVTAIANIANRAVDAGVNLAKSFTLDPMKQGFAEYELKMKSIQTILANTEGENLKSVTAALNELNEYSDKTIYNFANMTENIGKLTTAGLELETATSTVKGFHNMVALAGGDATAAAGAMEQFGQGLQAGTIKAMDWMSISNRGLGSQNLQRAFWESAKAAGTLTNLPVGQTFEEWGKANGGFKASLEEGWLTTEVATKALGAMTGDIKSVEELMKQGFSRQAAEDMLEIADNAVESATKVRTFTAFMDTTKEAIASGWGQVYETIVGDFNESTKLFTRLSDVVGSAIGKTFGYINNLVKGWDKMGGRAAALKTIKNVLSPIGAILGLIATAWKAAFGGTKTGKGLAEFTKLLEKMTRPLAVLGKVIAGAEAPLSGLFRILNIGKNVLVDVASMIGNLVEKLFGMINLDFGGPSTGGIVDFAKEVAKQIGDAIKKVDNLIEKGASLKEALGKVDISLPKLPNLPDISGMAMPKMGSAGLPDFSTMFSGFNTNAATSELDMVSMSLAGVSAESDKAATLGSKVMPSLESAWASLKKFFEGFNIEDLMASFNLAVLSTFMISLSRFMNTMSEGFKGFVGTGEAFAGVLGSAQDALGSFQTAARAKLIIAIAIAVGVLAVSLWLLSRIPMGKLATGLAGLAGLMIILKVGVMSIAGAVEKMEGKGTVFKLGSLSVALIALSVAILLLATAFLIMNKVDWASMLKGIGTIVIVMKLMEAMGKVGEHGAKNLMASAFALGAMAISITVLAGALLLFQLVKWESMAKGGLVLGGLVGALYLLAKLPAAAIAKAGTAMLAASFGFLLMANALLIFQLVKWESIAKGGVALAMLTASLAVLQVVGNPVAIAGLVGLGIGMVGLATAMMILNKVEWSSLAKAGAILLGLLAAFALLLVIVTVGAPAVALLSGLAVSLALLAGAIALLAFAFAIILPLMAIGIGAFAAFATGAAVAIGVFLTTLALQAPIMKKSILTILQSVIDGIVEAVPMIIDGIKRLNDAIIKEFSGGGGGKGGGKTGAAIGKSGESWMTKLKEKIKEKIPELVEAAKNLGIRFIKGLSEKAPELGGVAARFLGRFIQGVADNLGGVITAGANLLIQFIEGIGREAGRLAKAAYDVVIKFINELAETIRKNGPRMGDAMGNLGIAMIEGLIGGIASMAGSAIGRIVQLASDMIAAAKDKLKVFSPSRVFKSIGAFLVDGLTLGIQQNAASAITATASMVSGSIAVASAYVSQFVQELDQQAIAASGKAEGLRRAAEAASKAASTAASKADKAASKADKTKKDKTDDKAAKKQQKRAEEQAEAAEKMEKRASRAAKVAAKADAKAEAAAAREERAAEFAKADTFDKAKMRSEDAQAAMDAAKLAEGRAVASLAEADALEKQAKADGLTKKQREGLLKQAKALRAEARAQAKDADAQLANAQAAAGDALSFQKQAGDEAAAEFQRQFEAEANEDAEAAAFEKLKPEEKALERRRQAAALQAEADKNLAAAKKLAYSDLEAANELAAQAMEQAEQSRTYLDEAAQFEEEKANGTGVSGSQTGGRVVNLDPTEAASIAFNKYNDLYSDATAAAAGGQTVEFNQYNTSPEALPPSEIYRQSNNLLSFAADKLQPAP